MNKEYLIKIKEKRKTNKYKVYVDGTPVIGHFRTIHLAGSAVVQPSWRCKRPSQPPCQVPTSPLSPSGPYLLHELPKLSAPTVSGAGALCRDHSRADTFAIGCLGGGVELPALFWTLEESLQTKGCSQRGGTQRGPSTLLEGQKPFAREMALHAEDLSSDVKSP